MPFDAGGGVTNHNLITNPAAGRLQSNTTAALGGNGGPGFTSTGFQVDGTVLNSSTSDGTPPNNYVSWTFRKQPKFFDVVTYSGAGDGTTVSHNLGSTPGCVIVKATSGVDGWFVYHKDLLSAPPTNRYLKLNTTDATAFISSWISVSDTTITFPTAYGPTASSGTSYVAYLFAHDAGGFGLTGTDNVISCGSFTVDGSGDCSVSLGYEPQWIMVKSSTATDNWYLFDNMRGFPVAPADGELLRPNTAGAGITASTFRPTSTGFIGSPGGGFGTGIYIAIRRGPMKVPTSGTSVFDVDLAGNASAPSFTSAFPVDLGFIFRRSGDDSWYWVDRLRGGNSLNSDTTAAEASFATLGKFDYMNGYGSSTTLTNYTGWNFRRAPSFFDVVCYTGTGSARTVTHNLGVAPELIIVKRRDTTGAWDSYSSALANTEYVVLNTTAAKATGATRWNSTTPTSSVFSVGTSTTTNASAGTYVAYLFATCAGVSKVGSYTGNAGNTVTVPCGFTGGVRFVLIKRTDSTGDWYVWDSARGIIAGNDPYLLLNSTAAEVTGTDYVDTYSAGFEVTSTAPAGLNATGGNYIFLAIA
jgi:hypothetical protein